MHSSAFCTFCSSVRTYKQTELSSYIKPEYTGAWIKFCGRATPACMSPEVPQYLNTGFCFSYVRPTLHSYKESEDENLMFHKVVIYEHNWDYWVFDPRTMLPLQCRMLRGSSLGKELPCECCSELGLCNPRGTGCNQIWFPY